MKLIEQWITDDGMTILIARHGKYEITAMQVGDRFHTQIVDMGTGQTEADGICGTINDALMWIGNSMRVAEQFSAKRRYP